MTEAFAGIAGVASYLPEARVSAAELGAASGIPEDVFAERFGLRAKHIAADGEHVTDLAREAATRLLTELSGHESVLEAAVVGVPDQRWGETGLAFVVLRPGQDASAEELAAYCRARLARFKVPARFRLVTRLPKLTSGKLDKLTLRAMAADPPCDGNAGSDVS